MCAVIGAIRRGTVVVLCVSPRWRLRKPPFIGTDSASFPFTFFYSTRNHLFYLNGTRIGRCKRAPLHYTIVEDEKKEADFYFVMHAIAT